MMEKEHEITLEYLWSNQATGEFGWTIGSVVIAMGIGARELVGTSLGTTVTCTSKGVWISSWSSTAAYTEAFARVASCTVATDAITIGDTVAVIEVVALRLACKLAIIIRASHSAIRLSWLHWDAPTTATTCSRSTIFLNTELISGADFVGGRKGSDDTWC